MTSFSRSDFLKLVGIGFAAWKAPSFLLDIGLANTADEMELQIPQEFSEIKIPQENLNLRTGASILSEAFNIYGDWNMHTSVPPIHFERRSNYLTYFSFGHDRQVRIDGVCITEICPGFKRIKTCQI